MSQHHKPKRYFAVHSHFYQPPRENPWTGAITPQPSAAPYRDWNRRIARECYLPNLFARVMDSKGRVLEFVNNYDYMSFNFGPTLAVWLEKEYPFYYRRMIDTARRHREKHGAPNAIAQVYNHAIMPLASFNDQLTQMAWGLADFEYRFGFRAEAIWLAETACSRDTLRLLIDHGMKYVILSPYQAEKVRAPGAAVWTNISGGAVDPKRPYVWYDKSPDGIQMKNRSIAVFFYDGNLSKAVAFEGALKDSGSFAARVESCFSGPEPDQLVSVAVDGETFGHHHKFGDLTLAHAFRHELPARGIQPITFARYLQLHPPSWEAEIQAGPDGEGTAWSCAHGVRRWKGGCDCGKEGLFQLAWRLPLRAALNWLRDAALEVYKEEGPGYFKDIWAARNAYISVILDQGAAAAGAFLREHAARELSPEERAKAFRLLEMQRNSQLMFTSCGWFFSDISRVETVQNLKYAARTAELAAEFGFRGVDKGLASLLEMAPSNFTDYENGKTVYEQLAKSETVTPAQLAAFYLKLALAGRLDRDLPGGRTFRWEIMRETTDGATRLVRGRAWLNAEALGESRVFSFLYARFGGNLPRALVVETPGDAALDSSFEAAFTELASLPQADATERFHKLAASSGGVVPDQSYANRYELLSCAVSEIKTRRAAGLFSVISEYADIFRGDRRVRVSDFPMIKNELEFYAAETAEVLLGDFARTGSEESLDKALDLSERLSGLGLSLEAVKDVEMELERAALAAAEELGRSPSPELLHRLNKLGRVASNLGLSDTTFHLQNACAPLCGRDEVPHPENFLPLCGVLGIHPSPKIALKA
ncbi:MAG: glycoside hydrolase family protein [Elusimicrobia bacterium]|nr:MAG: glycoside hydrolase family protein [Elusimicrobiota bacterium]KAF0154570.1 MAG: glycoside hydrolase family protein [Elusimicrobiota bacterium]